MSCRNDRRRFFESFLLTGPACRTPNSDKQMKDEIMTQKTADIIQGALTFAAIAGVIAGAAMLTGCGTLTTPSTVTEYDADGKVTKVTVSHGSVIPAIVESTKNKTVIAWKDGWIGYISISSGTTDDPTPHGKIFAGKVNEGAISILPNQSGLPGIARVIQATKSDISMSLTDGVSATSSEIQTNGSGKTSKSDQSAKSNLSETTASDAKTVSD